MRAVASLVVLDDGPIRHITLSNGARRNPLSSNLISELRSVLVAAGNMPQLRVVILAAEGPAFSAWHDLAEIQAARGREDRGRAFFEALMADCAALMRETMRLPIPVMAAVEGVATAAGCYRAVEGAQPGRWLQSSYTTSLDVTLAPSAPSRWRSCEGWSRRCRRIHLRRTCRNKLNLSTRYDNMSMPSTYSGFMSMNQEFVDKCLSAPTARTMICRSSRLR
ncbi:MAG: enoyl-CoA hydratase-related protein [Hyphomicrobiales bacterium]|nr:enoyl-CoA hydratase-related protein [Hyphomicrobiales bacterium]